MNQFKYIEEGKRPWGKYFVIQESNDYKIKKIEVKPGARLSYQLHNKRSEVWFIIKGNGNVIIDSIKHKYKKGDIFQIPVTSKHRIENTGSNVTVLIEVQTGTYFGEDDIIRIQDDYNRI